MITSLILIGLLAIVGWALYGGQQQQYNELRYYYNCLQKGYDNVVKQRDKLEKDNKRYKERLERWRKEVAKVHKMYEHLQQPSD